MLQASNQYLHLGSFSYAEGYDCDRSSAAPRSRELSRMCERVMSFLEEVRATTAISGGRSPFPIVDTVGATRLLFNPGTVHNL